MGCRDRGRGQEFEHEIAVRDGIQRVRRGPVETERGCRPVAVDRVGRAGERGGAQRTFVEPSPRIGQPAAVAPQHLDIGEQMVAQRDRLRRLEMGEARHHAGRVLFRPVDKNRLQRP